MIGALTVSLRGNEAATRAAERSLEQQGFVISASVHFPQGVAQLWTPNASSSSSSSSGSGSSSSSSSNSSLSSDSSAGAGAGRTGTARTSDGEALCVGPIWYRGRFGDAALALLLAELDAEAAQPVSGIDETQLRGNFALFLHKQGRSWLLNDALGFVRIYGSADKCFYSTSWLAARAWSGVGEIDEDAAIEYVLLGAVHSDRTVARGVDKLPLGHGVDLSAGRSWNRFPAGIGPDAPFSSLEEGVEAIGGYLLDVFGEIASAFPGRTCAALSGGFDSRLIVAGLLAHGEQPRLFVYGGPGSEDVPIAQQVAQGEGIALTVVDKDRMNQGLPRPDLAQLVRNALFFDGLPNDGIDDPGADRRTRLEQGADGRVVLNGGGGEIFRNFFHLPERRFRPLDIVRAFYRGFDRAVFRRSGGLADYERGLAQSIAASLGLAEHDAEARMPLERAQTELVYPFFRCHHWMGLNNSAIVRHGYFGTPLVDLQTVRAGASLPLAWKNAGLFESRLIARLHAGIARHPSSYGFRFSDGPDERARRSEWLTSLRPASARPLINALGRAVHRRRVSPALIERCRGLLPGEWRLDPVLDLARLPDDVSFARALSVEVVFRELAP